MTWRDRNARIFRALLYLYPPRFRARYRDELIEFLRLSVRDARRRDKGRLVHSTHLCLDLIASAAREWGVVLSRTLHRSATDHQGEPMDTLFQDFRYAARALLRQPTVSLVAIATLALGIGATTTIFSIVEAVLIRSLPWPHADRLVLVQSTRANVNDEQVSVPDFADWRAQSRSFDEMGAVRVQSINLTGTGTPDRLVGGFVNAGLLRTFGAQVQAGRSFTDSETDVPTRQPVAIISDGEWRSRFGADPRVIGQTITLNGEPFTVIGVFAPGTIFPSGRLDVVVPLGYYPNAGALTRGMRGLTVMARLRSGVSVAAARVEMNALAARLAAAYPETNVGIGASVFGLKEQLVGDARTPLLITLAAVALVLLIACANVANLQLARAAARAQELSVRAALGAGRRRLMQQLLTESVLLGLIGGALGIALTPVSLHGLVAMLPGDLPVYGRVSINATVLIFALGATFASAFLFGLLPAWKAAGARVHGSLSVRSDRGTAGSRLGARGVLVTAQLALSIVLLVSAGLLVRSLIELQHSSLGFDARNLLTMEFRLPPGKYDSEEKIATMFTRAIAEIRGIPGVRSAALARAIPLSGNGERLSYLQEGVAEPDAGTGPTANLNIVSSGYFSTMSLALQQGRDFDARDRLGAPDVVVVNDELATRAWPGTSPLGKRLRLGPTQWATVVGLVENSRHYSLAEPPTPQIYVPYMQRPLIFTSVVVRTTGKPEEMIAPVRGAIWRVDPDQPVWKARSLASLVDAALGAPRSLSFLTGVFAVVALVLACIGIYGVTSYAVAQRTHEVGIRMALGARGTQVLGLVLRQGMRQIVVAIGIGLAAALVASRALASQLYGVSVTDPFTYVAVPVVLGLVALLACYIPARRASRVDPMVALRSN